MNNFDLSAIVDTLDLAFQKIRKLETEVARLRDQGNYGEAAEPDIPDLPCPYIFFPIKVSSVVSQVTTITTNGTAVPPPSPTGGYWGKIQKPTASTGINPYTDETSLSDIFVSVSSPAVYPTVNHIVTAFFYGTHSGAGCAANYGMLTGCATVIIGTKVESLHLKVQYGNVGSPVTPVGTWTVVVSGSAC